MLRIINRNTARNILNIGTQLAFFVGVQQYYTKSNGSSSISSEKKQSPSGNEESNKNTVGMTNSVSYMPYLPRK